MDDLQGLSEEEIELLDRVAGEWETYGRALREKLGIQGNMTWKTAKGAQYLVRYYRDDDGILVSKSLGRRSPETERIFQEFRSRRDSARQTVAEGEASMALVGRLVKAHGLARMPGRHAEILRAFWRESLDDQMMLFSGASLFAYERTGRALIPSGIAKDVVDTCPLHGVALALIDKGEDYAMRHDFSNLVASKIDRLPALAERAKHRSPTALQAYVLGRVDDRRTGPDFLDGMDLHVAIRTCDKLGTAACFGRKAHFEELDPDRRRDARVSGFEIARRGKEGVDELLREMWMSFLRRRSADAGGFGRQAFGALHYFLRTDPKRLGHGSRRAAHTRGRPGRRPLSFSSRRTMSPIGRYCSRLFPTLQFRWQPAALTRPGQWRSCWPTSSEVWRKGAPQGRRGRCQP